jgi:hypothetical protein
VAPDEDLFYEDAKVGRNILFWKKYVVRHKNYDDC